MKALKAMLICGAGLLLLGGMTGCATKKYVRTQVDPVRAQAEKAGQKAEENAKQISELDERLSRGVSAANERATTADGRAGQAGKRADEAMSKATEAEQQALEARQFADQGLRGVDGKLRLIGQYEVAAQEIVRFGFNRSELTAEHKAALDQLASKLADLPVYVVEVEGFTDSTGTASYNLELSRKRAEAVVRYLATTHQVPLHRVHVIGLGDAKPVSDNKSRAGRGENRRVEVRVLAPVIRKALAPASN